MPERGGAEGAPRRPRRSRLRPLRGGEVTDLDGKDVAAADSDKDSEKDAEAVTTSSPAKDVVDLNSEDDAADVKNSEVGTEAALPEREEGLEDEGVVASDHDEANGLAYSGADGEGLSETGNVKDGDVAELVGDDEDGDVNADEGNNTTSSGTAEPVPVPAEATKGDDDEDDGSDSDVIGMFGDEEEVSDDSHGASANPVARKRQKTGRESSDGTTKIRPNERAGVGAGGSGSGPAPPTAGEESAGGRKEEGADGGKPCLFSVSKLSKWAARLFDPNRPRGLVEGPVTIPLNDEFLEAFGRREKEHDEKTGRETEIDTADLDEEGEDNAAASLISRIRRKKKKDYVDPDTKVKITNLSYRTEETQLFQCCEQFGPLVECKLIMDREKPNSGLNIGRAFVTFESKEYTQLFINGANDKLRLDGRILRVALADSKPQHFKSTSRGGPGGGSGPSRYWDTDISTKCYRCGRVGHSSESCKYPEKARPCPICADQDPDHTEWSCPKRVICFKCGIPGHVSRECPERITQGKRTVCGNCLLSGHHRWACQENCSTVLQSHVYGVQHARCMQCGRLGHFSCKPLMWFFGLKGQWCFTCGQAGHHGMNCKGPNMEDCARNRDMSARIIEEATASSL